jgi:hypothetical protein
MAEVDLAIIRLDSSRETIRRPLHWINGVYAITFKRKKWAIDHDLQLDLRKARPLPDDATARFATPEEAAALVGKRRVNGLVSTLPALREGMKAADGAKSATSLLVITPATDPESDEFDLSQKIVIEEPETARQLIDAGPGTGKTAVACARVAWLAGNAGIPPAQIWLISFTRTAVQEIRERVGRLIDAGIANAVQMATLDSMAWQLNSRLTPGASLTGSFEDNIRALHGALEDNQTVEEYLQELRHLIVDEAQDIVGVRAELLLSLIEKLPPSCGVTVFSDEAQTIYGFASADDDDEHDGADPSLSLPKRVQRSPVGPLFMQRALAQVHRTSDPRLKTIFTQVRLEVLEPAADPLNRNQAIRKRLKQLAHGEASRKIEDAATGLPDDAFILFRRRIEAIRASATLRRAGICHRLRMSGLPLTIAPWIAAALGRAEEPRVGEKGFQHLWAEHVAGTTLATIGPEAAFNLLRDFAPDTTNRMIDTKLLRNKLAGRPSLAFTHVELGNAGPIVGTIHASKGREAASVTLMMPEMPDTGETALAIEEETRVLFVAATRTRQQLMIADAYRITSAQTESGRAYRFDKWNGIPKCDIELGRSDDLTAVGIAGRSYFSDPSVVLANQRQWIDLATRGMTVEAYRRKIGEEWRFCLCVKYGADPIAVLVERVDDDLWSAACHGVQHFRLSGRPRKPQKLDPVHVVGMRTIAVRADDPQANVLLEPWASTGLILAPLFYGFPRFTLKSMKA